MAIEEGIVTLDLPIGQPGCTLRHLLCHAGGYGFDGAEPISKPERNRIYSNTGIEMAASAVADASGMTFGDYLARGGAATARHDIDHAAGLAGVRASQHGGRPRPDSSPRCVRRR